MPPTAPASVLAGLLEKREPFLAFLQHRLGSRETAEDILQTAFLRAMNHADKLREQESAVAWFYRILRNAVIDHYRHEAVASRALEEWARELETHIEPELHTHDSICECITALLPDLKPEYREALKSVDIDEQKLKDFAEHAGISPTNAGVRVHRARLALKKQVAQTCGACAEHGCLDCDCRR